jgi:hypothetical protein
MLLRETQRFRFFIVSGSPAPSAGSGERIDQRLVQPALQ